LIRKLWQVARPDLIIFILERYDFHRTYCDLVKFPVQKRQATVLKYMLRSGYRIKSPEKLLDIAIQSDYPESIKTLVTLGKISPNLAIQSGNGFFDQ
jgi:hypothetical protein